MDRTAIYVPSAQEDLHAIWSYIKTQAQSSEVADRVVAAIDKRVRFYAQNPEIGGPRDELGSGVRCLTAVGFVAFYLTVPAGIEVIQVIHGARDLPRHFRRLS